MSKTDPNSTSSYFLKHLRLLAVIMVLGGIMLVVLKPDSAPRELHAWTNSGCDLARSACRVNASDGKSLEVSVVPETLTPGGAQLAVAYAGGNGLPATVQTACLDTSMNYTNVVLPAADTENVYQGAVALPACERADASRILRVIIGGESAVAGAQFMLSAPPANGPVTDRH